MSLAASVVLPAIRWDADQGYAPAMAEVERALTLGVGGFILFGGEREVTRALVERLRAASAIPLLIASDLERGAGQQFRGATGLPPLMGLAPLGPDAVRAAARITAREARDIGVNWVMSPVCDLDSEPDNPIVQTRSFGADPAEVGRLAAAWIAGCQQEGVLACAKHFPGHGRTTRDSHAELPVVDADRAALEADLAPFRDAIGAPVATVMTAHIRFPALDTAGPATYSRAILTDLLRGSLGFKGPIVTDALIMEGALAGVEPGEGAVRAIAAGCDLLCYPQDPSAVVAALDGRAGVDAAFAGRLAAAAAAREGAIRLTRPAKRLEAAAAAQLADEGAALARKAVVALRGPAQPLRGAVSIAIVDDDAGGPYPLPPRTAFAEALAAAGVSVESGAPRIVLLFADVKSWKGRAGLSAESRQRLQDLLAVPAPTIIFGHPRRLADVPGTAAVWCAWSGDAAMQAAAARRLLVPA